MDIQGLLSKYRAAKLNREEQEAKANELVQPLKDLIGKTLEMFNLKNWKDAETEAKEAVIRAARDELPPKRTVFDNGYIDVTPQDPQVIVVDAQELLAHPEFHILIEDVTISQTALSIIQSRGEIPGVMLAEVEPKVRISVKKGEENGG